MIRALFLVFTSGAAVMVSELVAGRLVAPCFGQSIRTWTALTGVTLLGCTLGNAVGALLSRRSPRLVAATALSLGGAAVVAVPFVLPLLASLGLIPAVALSWIVPSVLLGCVTPSAAAAVVRPDHNGTDLSRLYALSMTGSLLGAGFGGLLLPFVLPADTLYFILGGILLCAAPVALTLPTPKSNNPKVEQSNNSSSSSSLIPNPSSLRFSIFLIGYLGMAAEMAASKLVIPILGGNHIVWALIIVSFIGWMALGGSLGGRIADRFPRLGTAVTSLCLAAFGIAATALVETRLFTLPCMDALDVPLRLFLQIVLGLAPAAFTLGAANTALLKFATASALASGDRAAPGLFYALSSAGSVAGTFVTGLWCTGLVPGYVLMGVLAVATAAAALYLVWDNAELKMVVGMALVGVFAVTAFARRPVPHDIVVSGDTLVFSRESNYNVVGVTAECGHPDCRTIWLDRIGHTTVDISKPSQLRASYTVMIDAILTTLYPTNTSSLIPHPSSLSIFMIGGGGYALPLKWVNERNPPEKVVVAEIDPVVKEAAFAYLKPPRLAYPKEWSFPVGDGRAIVKELEKGGYDVVIGDTIADTAIPYHLVTAEFTAELKTLLKPDGVYLLHVLDVPAELELASTLAATMRTAFSHVGGIHFNGLASRRQSIILVGTDDPKKLDLPAFAAAVKASRPVSYPHTLDFTDTSSPALSTPHSAHRTTSHSALVLTDRFAPVERWVWRTITSSMETRATRYGRLALDARNANDMVRCREFALRALDIDPDHVWGVEAIADCLDENPDDAEALKRLEFAASRENPDPYAKKRLERFRKGE